MIEHGIPSVRSKLLTLDIQSSTEDISSPRLIHPIAGKLGVSSLTRIEAFVDLIRNSKRKRIAANK
ncbi:MULTISPECIES: hypothetical protein [unclassified Mesotoga]|jgi:hypothetical protein|uniref:hypothetical protein n=1 Tax=unclassified Mesotoga TaxID=1184398 RepID=UPI0025F55314|nr:MULTISPECIES: hypothetical protein [unclassified Mesotoga]MDD3461091.1 hypothetical protein [Mesotoga sp.]HNS35716.1 hypothetical protein [Mesotoga sp.]